MTPFDWIKAINEKTPIEFDEGEYVPFVINKGLSFHQQTIFFANCMNEYYNLKPDQQFKFYVEAIPKGKRYSKWEKKQGKEEDVVILQEYFCINNRVAEQYLKLLSAEELEIIRTKMRKGGR